MNRLVEVAYPSVGERALGLNDIAEYAKRTGAIVNVCLTWNGQNGPWCATLEVACDRTSDLSHQLNVWGAFVRRVEDYKGLLKAY